MEIYLEDFLDGFIPRDKTIETDHYTEEKAAFLIVDRYRDKEPELLILFKQQGEEYLGIIKRKGSFWRLKEVWPNEEDETMLGDMLEPIVNDKITVGHVGEAYKFTDLFGIGDRCFFNLVGRRSSYCHTRTDLEKEEAVLEVIDFKQGNVYGMGAKDDVYLLGTRILESDGPEVGNLTLRVVNGSNKEEIEIRLKMERGYVPKLIVEDFTGDLKKDVLVTSYSKPLGGISAQMYSLIEDELIEIFSTESFNEVYKGEVVYQDDYRVMVTTNEPGKVYYLDLSGVPVEKLQMLYDTDKKLKLPTQGALGSAIAVNVVDYDYNGVYDLAAVQGIAGSKPEDNLGLVETFLKWSYGYDSFVPYMQYVSIYGSPKSGQK